jgi:hypothetical protein
MLYFVQKRATFSIRALFIFLIALLLSSSLFIYKPTSTTNKAYASFLDYLPSSNKLLSLTSNYNYPLLKGIQFSLNHPFKFTFIIDKEDAYNLDKETLKKHLNRIIKYFLSSLTIKEENLWVNLNPYQKDKILPFSLGETSLGRDLLGSDYILKQLVSSLTYPDSKTGKEFWQRIYKKAYILWGTTKIPINTFQKIWIVPQKAVIYETKQAAFIKEAYLKVMLDKDYLSLKEHLKKKKQKKSAKNTN